MQNKANFVHFSPEKGDFTKKQTQFKPNLTQYKANLTQNKPNSNPTCRGVAPSEAGSKPIMKIRFYRSILCKMPKRLIGTDSNLMEILKKVDN
jgi:hypothetical protein